MQSNLLTYQILQTIYTESKFWLALGGGLWSVFKGVAWIKSIKENDLHHIQLGVDGLTSGLKDQTTSVVKELQEMRTDFVSEMKEMRADFRTFYPQPRRSPTPKNPRPRNRK